MFEQVISELVGTTILSTIIGITLDATWSAGLNEYYSPWAVGVALLSAMVATGFISGAQFNPAVTVAVIVKSAIEKDLKKNNLVKYLIFIPTQIVGAYIGASLAYAMTNKTNYIDIGPESGKGAAFLAEAFFTFLLASAALMAGNVSNNNIIAGSSVAATLFAAASTIGAISGACLNPAVGIGINTIALRKHSDACDHLWIYIFAPLVGGVLSAGLNVVFKKELDRQEEEKASDYKVQK